MGPNMLLRTAVALLASFQFVLWTRESAASLVFVSNPSFEETIVAPGNFATTTAPPGWAAYGDIDFNSRAIGSLNPNTTTLYTQSVPHGSNVGVVFLMDDFNNQNLFNNSEGGMQQTLSATLQNSATYTLNVDVGNIGNDVNFPHNLFQFNGFPGYRIDFLAGSTVLASDSSFVSTIPAEGNFRTSTITYSSGASNALAGQALGIRLVNLNNSTGIEVNFDNVRLELTAVPEPSTALVLSIVGVGTAMIRGRLRRAKTGIAKR